MSGSCGRSDREADNQHDSTNPHHHPFKAGMIEDVSILQVR
jgi:hypothetical protein